MRHRVLTCAIAVCLFAPLAHAQGGRAYGPGTVSGRVMIGPGVPAPSCEVAFEGTNVVTICDADGNFMAGDLFSSLAHTMTIKVPNLPVRRIERIQVNEGSMDGKGFLTVGPNLYLGELRVGQLGAVTGQVTLRNTADLDATVVAIPALGLFTQVNVGGFYLLNGVAPGTWTFVVYVNGVATGPRSITVGSGQLLPHIDVNTNITVPATPTLPRPVLR